MKKLVLIAAALLSFVMIDNVNAFCNGQNVSNDTQVERIKITTTHRCDRCGGSGQVQETVKCNLCNGSGCNACNNTGYKTEYKTCPVCHGRGSVKTNQYR